MIVIGNRRISHVPFLLIAVILDVHSIGPESIVVIADVVVCVLILIHGGRSRLCDQPLKFRFTRDGCVISNGWPACRSCSAITASLSTSRKATQQTPPLYLQYTRFSWHGGNSFYGRETAVENYVAANCLLWSVLRIRRRNSITGDICRVDILASGSHRENTAWIRGSWSTRWWATVTRWRTYGDGTTRSESAGRILSCQR